MNIAEYLGSEEKPSAPSLKWWIEHKAKPVPIAGKSLPVFRSLRFYPKPPIEEALEWAKKFTAEGKSPCHLCTLVGKKINRTEKRVRFYLADYLAELQAK